MSIEISAAASTLSQTSMSDDNRRSANFHPSIWGDHFLSYQSDDNNTESSEIMVKHQKLKEQVRKLLKENDDKVSEILQLIDAIQRLGISYHFETEIDEILKRMVESDNEKNELYEISLMLRLVRQQGYNMSCDVFNRFRDSQGNFKDSVVNDPRGMLSLYEATHMRVHGEHILEEALAFTTTHLSTMATQSSCPLADQISHAFMKPIRKGLPRLEARNFVSIYEGSDSYNQALLSFAKLDFNILQKQHQKELSRIAMWWKDLNFATKVPFARDRVVECYFWILSVYFEPHFSFARRIMTKIISLASVLDDIYDVYGTLEELTLFTEAIQRWDISVNAEQIPECMILCFQALLDVFKEIEIQLAKEGRCYGVHYAKEANKKFVQSYYNEAIWLHRGIVPSMEEYMSVALESCGYPMLTVISFIGMGDIASKEAFEWVSNSPKIITAASIICRLTDDIVSYKYEKKTGKIATSVECYTRQYKVTEEEACKEFNKRIASASLDINKELLKPTEVPLSLLMRPFNLTRVMDVLYKDGDNYANVSKAVVDGITSLLVHPIPL